MNMDTSTPATSSTITIDGGTFKRQRLRQVLRRVLLLSEDAKCPAADSIDALDAEILDDAVDAVDAIQSVVFDIVDQLLTAQHCPGLESLDIASASALLNVSEMDRLIGSAELRCFVYLLQCFQRVRSEENNNWVAAFEEQTKLLERVSFVLLDMAIALLQGAISRDSLTSSGIGSLLVRMLLLDRLPNGFLDRLIEHAEKASQLESVVNPMLDSIARAASRMSFECASGVDEPYRLVAGALRSLCSVRQPNTRPPRRPVCSVDDGGKKFFPTDDIEAGTREMVYKTIRERLGHIRLDCHAIVREVLGNPDSRVAALDWLQAVANRNIKKTQMRADDSKLANDGFMLNALAVMYDLSRPITMDKVQRCYPFHKAARIDLTDLVRFKSCSTNYRQYIEKLDLTFDPNFPTECFFLTVHMQHAALVPALNTQENMQRSIAHEKRNLAEAERQLKEENLPAARRQRREARVSSLKQRVNFLNRLLWCGEAVLQDEGLMSSALQFCVKQLSFLISTLQSENDACEGSSFSSLPEKPTLLFRALPECYLEDVLDLLIQLISYTPGVLISSCPPDLLEKLLVFVVHTDYCNNPFLASKCIKLLFHFTPIVQPAAAPLFNSLLNHPLANDKLFPSLIKFYSDCESTGSHTEFFDKFDIRGHIQVIFETLRKNALYRHHMIEYSRQCDEHFTRFINMLINDTTFLLDETVESLKSIRQTENDMADTATWNQLSRHDQEMRTGQMNQNAGSVRSWLGLAHRTLDMFQYMTHDAPEPFLSPVLGERLAAMLNYNLVPISDPVKVWDCHLAALCGPKCSGLKVNNPQQYNWNPRKLVEQLVGVYLNLDSPEFVNYIAADERSYSEAMFSNALERMCRFNIVAISQMEQLRDMADRAAHASRDRVREDECLGDDAPPEYLDPIMGTLMCNPVQLPSGNILDRKTIERHLLSTPLDPFTRAPLTLADVKPVDKLREEIMKWKEQRLAERNG